MEFTTTFSVMNCCPNEQPRVAACIDDAFGLRHLLIELFYNGMPVARTEGGQNSFGGSLSWGRWKLSLK